MRGFSSALAQPAPPSATEAQSSGRRKASVWIQPVGALAMAAGRAIYIPLGANIPVEPSGLDIVVEATVTGDKGECFDHSGGILTVGPSVYLASADRGFFLQPKASLELVSTTSRCRFIPGFIFPTRVPTTESTTGQSHVGLGLDVGYRFNVSPVYVALVIGAGVGYCDNCPGHGLFPIGLSFGEPERSSRTTLTLNANLLRLGASF
jgi:hypothetical protein